MEETSATIRPAIWRTILSRRDWPSDGSAMISRSLRMMMRSAGSVGAILVSAPFVCIPRCPYQAPSPGDRGAHVNAIAAKRSSLSSPYPSPYSNGAGRSSASA